MSADECKVQGKSNHQVIEIAVDETAVNPKVTTEETPTRVAKKQDPDEYPAEGGIKRVAENESAGGEPKNPNINKILRELCLVRKIEPRGLNRVPYEDDDPNEIGRTNSAPIPWEPLPSPRETKSGRVRLRPSCHPKLRKKRRTRMTTVWRSRQEVEPKLVEVKQIGMTTPTGYAPKMANVPYRSVPTKYSPQPLLCTRCGLQTVGTNNAAAGDEVMTAAKSMSDSPELQDQSALEINELQTAKTMFQQASGSKGGSTQDGPSLRKLETRKHTLDKCVDILQKIQQLGSISQIESCQQTSKAVKRKPFFYRSWDAPRFWTKKPIIVGRFEDHSACTQTKCAMSSPNQDGNGKWSFGKAKSSSDTASITSKEIAAELTGRLQNNCSSFKAENKKTFDEMTRSDKTSSIFQSDMLTSHAACDLTDEEKKEDIAILDQIRKIDDMIKQSWIGETNREKTKGNVAIEDNNGNYSGQHKQPDVPYQIRCRGGSEGQIAAARFKAKSENMTRGAQACPKVLWAVTKINIYPDDSRTYEVMKLSEHVPCKLPPSSDCIFVLVPPS